MAIQKEKGGSMRGSLIALAFIAAGMALGYVCGDIKIPHWIMTALLCLLMLQVGLGIGCSDELGAIRRSLRPQLLLIPLSSLAGTIIFSAPIAWIVSRWSAADCIAVGCGMGYYSLSSIIITQLKVSSIGMQAAAELGTIALLSNIFRELAALIGAPLWHKFFGPIAPIAVGGATTADVTLPAILSVSGREWLAVAVINGILLDMSVPLFVPLFC